MNDDIPNPAAEVDPWTTEAVLLRLILIELRALRVDYARAHPVVNIDCVEMDEYVLTDKGREMMRGIFSGS